MRLWWKKALVIALLLCAIAAIYYLFCSIHSPLPLNSLLCSAGQEVSCAEGNNDWTYSVITFYEKAADYIVQSASKRGIKLIKLVPETNTSLYHCASPCNEGLAMVLHQRLLSEGKEDKEIVFWYEPMYPGRVAAWMNRYLAPVWAAIVNSDTEVNQSLAWHEQGWFGIDSKGCVKPKIITASDTPLTVSLEINRVSLEDGKFEACFQVRLSGISQPQNPVFKDTYSGNSNQIYWFVRRKTAGWLLFFLIFVCCIVLVGVLISLRGKPREATKIGYMCCLLGLCIVLFFIFLAVIPRQRVQFNQTTRIHYVVDRTGEIWFPLPETVTNKVGYSWFAHRLEQQIRKDDSLCAEIPGSKLRFLTWLLTKNMKYSLTDVYRKQRCSLHKPYELLVHEFSGEPGKAWRTVNSLSAPPITTTSRLASRITNVRQKLSSMQSSEGSKHKWLSIALLLTSACAASWPNVHEYLESIKDLSDAGGPPLEMLTVITPSLPRTGDSAPYNFENGKLALMALSSDHLITLNKTVPDVDVLLNTLSPPWRTVLRARLGNGVLKSLSKPMFSLSTLNNPHHWDTPCDLDKTREDYLLVPRQRAKNACQEVITELKKIVSERTIEKNLESIHVIGQTPIPWLALAVIVIFLLGFFAFVRQYDDLGFRQYYHNNIGQLTRIWYYTGPVMSVIFAVTLFFGIVWRCRSQQCWTDFGSPTWALFAGIICWLAWMESPRMFFRWWGTKDIRKSAKIYYPLLVVIVIFTLLTAWYLSFGIKSGDSPGALLFMLLFVIVIALGVLIGIIPWGAIGPAGTLGKIAWWQHPSISVLVKTILLLSIIVLFRGAFPASPGAGRASSGFLMYRICSYSGFIALVAVFWSVTGLAIACTDLKKNFWYWLGPVFSLILSIWLLIGV